MDRMPDRIDNDATKGLAQPFLILAHVRTGGTFCAHALSNHPQVYCDRGETLHHLSAWRRAGIPVEQTVGAIWHMDGYHAAGFRAIYRQAFHPKVWPLIERAKPPIIHVTRRNVTRQGVSYAYQQMVRQGQLPYHPVHTFARRTPAPVRADVRWIVGLTEKVAREVKLGRVRVAAYEGPVMEIVYEEMVGAGPSPWMANEVAYAIEDQLGVRREPLRVDLKRDFPVPMAKWFTNWAEIRSALDGAGFGGLDG
jgi:hypothetical protein